MTSPFDWPSQECWRLYGDLLRACSYEQADVVVRECSLHEWQSVFRSAGAASGDFLVGNGAR